MNKNSIKAYKEIREDGTLTKRQMEVMSIFHYNDPMPLTAKMVSGKVPNGWKRLSELEAMGLIKVSGECTDMDTHKTVSVYSLGKGTSNKPKKLSREALVDHIKYLQARIEKTYDIISACADAAYKQGVADVIAGRVPGIEMREKE